MSSKSAAYMLIQKAVIRLVRFAPEICVILFFIPQGIVAQITFSPTVLMLDQNDPVKEIRLTNLSDYPQEVEIIKRFGYPVTQTDGRPGIMYTDESADSLYALTRYLNIYPSKVVIPARTRQTIRIQVQTDERMKDQVYWSRLGIRSRLMAPDVGIGQNSNSSQSISYMIQQNMGVYFAYGDVETSIKLDSLRYSMGSDTLYLLADVSQLGNSPYFGAANFRLLDDDGLVLSETGRVISVFFGAHIAATMILQDIPAGSYTIEIGFETERGDIKVEDLIQSSDQTFLRKIVIGN